MFTVTDDMNVLPTKKLFLKQV